MPPKLIASDLDGTLLRSDGTLDQGTREVLSKARAAGAMLVLCTARPARWMAALAELLPHGGVAICVNGGVIWDLERDSLIEAFPLLPALAREVVTLLGAALPGAAWAVERTHGFAKEPAYKSRWPAPPGAVIAGIETLLSEPPVKLMLRHDLLLADALLERALGVVGHLVELTHSNSSDGLLEISAAGVSKASTLAQLCARLGIDRSEVIAFGDMPNDLPMLRWAGHGVAVANAHPDLLAAADEVTASNDDGGVARVIERLFGYTASQGASSAAA